MIFLGLFKAGTAVKYRAVFHTDLGTLENPTSPEAQLETPAGVFSDLTAPAIVNAKVGCFGGSIDTAGFAAGVYFIRMAGTVSTAKTTATVFCFQIVAFDPADAVRLGLSALPAYAPAAAGGLPTVDVNNRIAGIQGTKNTLDNLNDIVAPDLSLLDVAVSSRLASGSFVAPNNSGITDIKAKTDQLVFTTANRVDASATSSLPAGMEQNIIDIKAKTDNLPVDPATQTLLQSTYNLVDAIDTLVGTLSGGSAATDTEGYYASLLAKVDLKMSGLLENPQVDYRVGNTSVSASQKMKQLMELRSMILKRMAEKPKEVIETLQTDFSDFGEDLNEYQNEDE
jgi:hypothetical protein